MKRKVSINKEARTVYIPKEIVEDGFEGEADAYADAFTLTITKPGATLSQVRRSLQLVIQDLEMREEIDQEEAKPRTVKA